MLGRAQGEQGERGADIEREEDKQEGAAPGVDGEGMDRRQTPERTRNVPTIDIEKAITASIIVHALKRILGPPAH